LKAFGHLPEEAISEVLDMGFSRMQAIERDGRLTSLDSDQIVRLTDTLMAGMEVVNLLFRRDVT
jgi:hypothetical protein